MRAADKTPKDEDVKAGWTAFVLFLLLIAAVVVLGFSLVKQLRKAQAAEDAGVYGSDEAGRPGRTPTRSPRTSPRTTRPSGGRAQARAGARAGLGRGRRARAARRRLPRRRRQGQSDPALGRPDDRDRAGLSRGPAAGGWPSTGCSTRFRGWDATHTPVADCDWAIEQVAARYPSAPVGLVGHSLGGRAALVAGDNPAVRSVAVLNPWLYPADDPDLSGRSVLFVHGAQDRVASIDKAEAVARRLTRRTSVGFIRIPDGKHAMLRHGSAYDRYAATFTAAVLLDEPSLAQGPVARVLSGESWLTA